jgi:prepilin-type N-terminal cleavage/methylation domain-containing protein
MNSHRRDNTKGFSLIEILISITIFALITVAVISDFRSGEFKNQLSIAAQNVASELRETQTMVSAGQPTMVCLVASVVTGNCEDDPGSCAGDCVENVPAGGYGLVFKYNSENIILFSNTDATDDYDAADEKIRDLKVSPTGRVEISTMTVSGVPVEEFQIIIMPPTNEMIFTGPDLFGNPPEARIELKHQGMFETREIYINRISGRIDVIKP